MRGRKVFKNVPEKIISILSKTKCPGCQKHYMDASGIEGIGIRKGFTDKDNTYFVVNYCCEHCNDRVNIETERCNLEEFYMLISNGGKNEK